MLPRSAWRLWVGAQKVQRFRLEQENLALQFWADSLIKKVFIHLAVKNMSSANYFKNLMELFSCGMMVLGLVKMARGLQEPMLRLGFESARRKAQLSATQEKGLGTSLSLCRSTTPQKTATRLE